MKGLAANLADALDGMIQLKSRRDNMKFTAYKLSQQTGVDRSLLQRLLSGEIQNPRLDTIIKIIDFFVKDGFPISLNDIMQWKSDVISIHDQTVIEDSQVTLPLYQMKNFSGERIGNVSVFLPSYTPGTIALLAEEDTAQIFKSGSIFIVDMMKHPESGNMVMVRQESHGLLPAKFTRTEKKVTLTFYSGEKKALEIPVEEVDNSIIGVVTRINAKT